MKILVTGAKGFIGKNLVTTLKNICAGEDKSFEISESLYIYEYDIESNMELLDFYCTDCDFVFHLAGVNRPKEPHKFMEGNFGLTSVILKTLRKHANDCPVMISSSVQAEQDNPYGQSKKAGEELVFSHGKETGAEVYVYRFPNVFGKWCKPNYNSAVATFCNNIACGLPICINDSSKEMCLVYIDDVVRELIGLLKKKGHKDTQGFYYVPMVYSVTLGQIVDLLYSFRDSRREHYIPDMTEGSFEKKLYAAYLSYLPADQFSYPLKMNRDGRGSFTEILRTADRGQFSVNILKPGIIKGNHWHHTKNEKFVVVSGKGLIQLRRVDSDQVIEYHVSGERMEVVDIPVGYTHNIINEGETDLVTFIWCNECYDSQKADTYSLKVTK